MRGEAPSTPPAIRRGEGAPAKAPTPGTARSVRRAKRMRPSEAQQAADRSLDAFFLHQFRPLRLVGADEARELPGRAAGRVGAELEKLPPHLGLGERPARVGADFR